MNELNLYAQQLPDNISELVDYVLIGREQLSAIRAKLRAIDKVGAAETIRKQTLISAQDLAEALLDAEIRLGELIAEIPEKPGLRRDLHPQDSTVQRSKKEIIMAAGLSVKQAQRYERLAANPKIVMEMKKTARDTGEIISRTAILTAISNKQKAHQKYSTGDDNWFTPAVFIEAARLVMGNIDLDPASCDYANQTVKADTYYTVETNGLRQEWFGRIWLNPPYSSTQAFIEKLLTSDFEQAIVLINNSTETYWFRKLVEFASAIVFVTGRIKFEREDGPRKTPLQGQAIIYFGNRVDVFRDIFSEFGWYINLADNH